MGVTRPVVVVLGAGASFGARPDEGNRAPPLGNDLAEYLLRWLDLNPPNVEHDDDEDVWGSYYVRLERLQAVRACLEGVKAADPQSAHAFETLLEDAVGAGDIGLLADINDVIARSMIAGRGCRFLEHRDLLDTLVARYRGRLSAVLSFNYDTLTEDALGRAGVAYQYPGVEPPTDETLPLFKIHGSLNWLQVLGTGGGSSLEIARANHRPTRLESQSGLPFSMNTDDVYAARGRENTRLEYVQAPKPTVLATYVGGKPAVHSRDVIDRVRGSCLELVRNADVDSVVIGVRPPVGDADDPTWSELARTVADISTAWAAIDPVLREVAVPFLERVTSDEDLRDYWLAKPEGTRSGPEDLALGVLLRDIGPRERLAPFLDRVRASVPPGAVGFAGAVERLAASAGLT